MDDQKKDQIEYNRWWSNFQSLNIEEPGSNYRANLVVGEIRSLDVKDVADLGCGAGDLIKKINHSIHGLSLTGFDVSSLIIERNKKEIKDVIFSTINLNENFVVKDKFDLVICSEVIEHVKNWENAVFILAQCVKSGGYLIITTQAGKIYTHHKTLGHLRHFKKDEIEVELKKNRVTIIKSFYSGWPFMNIKNLLVNMTHKSIEDSSFSFKKQSFVNRIAFAIFGFLYRISSRRRGPQIYVLGKKGN